MLRRLGIAESSALALVVSVGCGQSNTSPLDAGFDPSVYQHHRNGTRDGLYIDPVFTQTAAKTTHVLTGFMGAVSTAPGASRRS